MLRRDSNGSGAAAHLPHALIIAARGRGSVIFVPADRGRGNVRGLRDEEAVEVARFQFKLPVRVESEKD